MQNWNKRVIKISSTLHWQNKIKSEKHPLGIIFFTFQICNTGGITIMFTQWYKKWKTFTGGFNLPLSLKLILSS